MSITMAGPLCDVCGSYFLLDPEMFCFRVKGIEQELHCHPRCKPIVEAGVWQDLPDGPLRKAFEEATEAA